MKKYLILAGVLVLFLVSACSPRNDTAAQSLSGQKSTGQSVALPQSEEQKVSGTLKNGLRTLDADTLADGIRYTVYRGDYITFSRNSKNPVKLQIPSLAVDTVVPLPSDLPYIKMKDSGEISITLDGKPGIIKVIDYTGTNYHELSASESDALIKNINPLILDVRTKGEYDRGHIENSMLIPVQSLSDELDKLAKYKNENILIYCASGNRSTVAANILIDAGYTKIYNMRHGIGDWIRKGLPVVKD
ncbi:MAG: rhodanese-like domain-containing protein [Spirochaetia bacterium]|jgi:rhodanese-related sulfurtransferase|nr:rhodanese-like domain-containing protein [Spirochaetia bacterium]